MKSAKCLLFYGQPLIRDRGRGDDETRTGDIKRCQIYTINRIRSFFHSPNIFAFFFRAPISNAQNNFKHAARMRFPQKKTNICRFIFMNIYVPGTLSVPTTILWSDVCSKSVPLHHSTRNRSRACLAITTKLANSSRRSSALAGSTIFSVVWDQAYLGIISKVHLILT